MGLTKIMRGAAPKAMSRRVRFATTLCAALLLPLQPFVFGSASVSTLRVESIQDSGPLSVISGQEREVGYLMPGPQIEEGISSVSNDSVPDTAPRASTKRGNRGEKVWSTAASADGRFVVRATTARRVVLTDLNSNAETDLPYELIKAVAFAPDGDWFTAAGQNGQITIWDSARGELLRTVATHSGILRSVAVSPRGDTIAAGSRDGSVLLINLANDELLVDLPTFSSAVNCVRFSSDGRQLAVAVGDWMSNARGEVALLNVTTGQIEVRLPCAAC